MVGNQLGPELGLKDPKPNFCLKCSVDNGTLPYALVLTLSHFKARQEILLLISHSHMLRLTWRALCKVKNLQQAN